MAEITVSRVEPEIYVPPLPGAQARRAEDAERDHALFFDDMEHRVPIGLGRDGAPLYANLEFLDGTRGAHVNISGISGVATKTSYATFLLYSMFHSGVLGAEAVNTKALIFNVKGEDLLFLDQPNGEARRGAAGPLPHARPHARALRVGRGLRPAAQGDPNAGPDVATRTTGVSTYYWTIADFVEGRAAPVRVRRRGRRAPAVHDGDPQRCAEAQASTASGSATTVPGRSKARRSAPITSWSS